MWLEVEFDGTEPGLPRSTSWALPVHRETVDSCSEGTLMILCWVSLSDVTEKTVKDADITLSLLV